MVAGRARTMRNLLGTLLLSTGVPMLNAGDEMGRTQGGNNNAYCQDNATSWIDWDLSPWQRDLLATTQHLVRLRQALPALRQRVWALGRQVHDDGSRDMEWYAADGTAMGQRWDHPGTRVVQMYVGGAWLGADSALVVVNGGAHEHAVTLPGGTRRHGIPAAVGQRPRPAATRGRAGGAGHRHRGRHQHAGLRGGRRHLTASAADGVAARHPGPTTRRVSRPRLTSKEAAAALRAARSGRVPPRPSAPVGSITA